MNREISEISLRIRELREVCGYTVEELAAELKLAPEVYREYEEKKLIFYSFIITLIL